MRAIDREVFREALEVFGIGTQLRKLFEEVAEMLEAVCKCADGRDTVQHLAEEIADVRIMLDQMCILYDCELASAEQYSSKVKRLRERVKEAGGAPNERC